MKKAIALLALVASAGMAQAALVGNGNLVVFQAGAGGTTTLGNNAPFRLIEVNSSTPGQTLPVQAFDVSGAGTNPMWTSASATSTGYLSLSQNRQSVQFTGHTTRGNSPFPNINTVTARGVGSLDVNFGYNQLATYTGSSGQQTRSAALRNSGDLFIIDQGGVYAPGASTTTTTNNVRNARTFGGTTFVMQQSTVVTTIALSTLGGTPAAPTITGVAGLTNNNTIQDFYMVESSVGSGFNLLYFTTTTGFSKFELVAGSWVARGTATVTGGLFGLAAQTTANGVQLFATTGGGAGNANTVTTWFDTATPSSNIALSAPTVLFTAATNTTLKGIELVPVPTPGAAALLAIGGLAATRRRRSN